MKSFKQNLKAFQTSNGLSDSDILELSELSEPELSIIEHDGKPRSDKLLYKFCVNTDIDYSSVYSDTGFEVRTLAEQYAAYPTQYKFIVTKHLIDALSIMSDMPKANFYDFLEETLSASDKFTAKLLSGAIYLPDNMLSALKTAFTYDVIHDSFDLVLGTVMFSKIRNYNYNITREYFKVSYKQIGKYLKLSSSGVSNWGGRFCSGIPDDALAKICKAFGGFSVHEFKTQFVNKVTLSTKSCKLASNTKHQGSINSAKEEIQSDLGDLIYEPSKGLEIPSKVVTNDRSNLSLNSPLSASRSIELDHDKILKMFNNLPEGDKMKIEQQIVELFFKNL